MGRAKKVFTEELAERAEADMRALDRDGVVQKLKAIAAAARLPVEVAAGAHFVAAETVWRWAVAYARDGLDGLRPKPKRPRPSKLGAAQKAAVLSWLGAGETAGGEPVHWTLEGLRAAIADEFGVALCPAAIWAWLRKEGWGQRVPRPRHHKADRAAQDEFKKKRRSWQGPTRTRPCSTSTRRGAARSPRSAGAGRGGAGAPSPS